MQVLSFFSFFIIGLSLFSSFSGAAQIPSEVRKDLVFIPAGPVELHSSAVVNVAESEWQRLPSRQSQSKLYLPVIRFESYGNTEFTFEVNSPAVTLAWEGPFATAEEADKASLGDGKLTLLENCSRKEEGCLLVAQAVGIYRLYVVPSEIWQGKLPDKEEGARLLTRLLTRCATACGRPTVNWQQLVLYLSKKKKAGLLEKLPSDLAARWHLKPEEVEAVRALLAKKLDQAALGDQSPAVVFGPPSKLGKLQELLKAAEITKPLPLRAIQGKLEDLLAKGSADRERNPKPPIPELPEIAYGHYIDNRMSEQELRDSRVVADILSALSEPKLATHSYVEVEWGGATKKIKTPLQFIKYLLDTGHTIEVRDERTYANFFSLRLGPDTDAILPPWLDTGLELSPGQKLIVPMGHSQHAWRIWGPKISARVAFFLGITGTGYFPAIDSRPLWTGMRAIRSFASYEPGSEDYLLRSVMFSNYYLERNRKERDKLPQDGYGLLGVCNDANAVVSYGASAGKYPVSVYPLLRAPEASLPVKVDDVLSDLLPHIPRDPGLDLSGGPDSEVGREVLRRILSMNPHDLGSPWYPMNVGQTMSDIAERLQEK